MPGDPERVVVEPQRRGLLAVWVEVDGGVRIGWLGGEVPRAVQPVVGEPGLRSSVRGRLILGAVQVDDGRDRAGVRREHTVAGVERVGPVDGLVDGQVAAQHRVSRQGIHVLDRGRGALLGFHRDARPLRPWVVIEGRIRITPQVRASPERARQRGVERVRKHILLELVHDRQDRRTIDPPAHERRQRRDELRHAGAGQRGLRYLDRRARTRQYQVRAAETDGSTRSGQRPYLEEVSAAKP